MTARGVVWALLGAAAVTLASAWLAPRGPWYAEREGRILYPVPGARLSAQWHEDTRIEVQLAGAFPDALSGGSRQRTNRPLYAGVANFGVRLACAMDPTLQEDRARRRQLATFLLIGSNAVYLAVAAILILSATRRLGCPDLGVLTVALIYGQTFLLEYAAQCMTHAYLHLSPGVLFWAWARTRSEPSGLGWRESTALGLGMGLLYLGKPNLAVVLTLVPLLLLRDWRRGAAVALLIPVPYLLYRVYLGAQDIPYYHHEVERYGQGVWLLDAAREGRWLVLAEETSRSVVLLFRNVGVFFGFALVPAVWALVRLRVRFRGSCPKAAARWALVLVFWVGVQMLASQRYDAPYITAELFIVILPLAAWALRELAERRFGGAVVVGVCVVVAAEFTRWGGWTFVPAAAVVVSAALFAAWLAWGLRMARIQRVASRPG